MKHTLRPTWPLAIAALLFMLSLSSVAVAQETPDKLIKYAPEDTGMLIGVDVKGSSKSPIYKELLTLIKAEKDVQEGIKVLKDKIGFDAEKDLFSVVVSMSTPEGQGENLEKQFVVAISGKFNEKKIQDFLKKEGGDELTTEIHGLKVLAPEPEIGMALVNKTTLVLVKGPDTYREKAWANVAGKGKDATQHAGMGKLIGAANTKQNHIWMMANARKLTQPEGPQVQTGIVEISLKSGLAIAARLKMKSDGDATQAVADLEQSLPSAKAFAAMISAEALLDNLKYSANKDLVSLSTSMNDAQLKKSIKAVKDMNAKDKKGAKAQ